MQTADRTLSVVSEETAQGCHFCVCRQNERWLGRANAFARMKRVMTGQKQMSFAAMDKLPEPDPSSDV